MVNRGKQGKTRSVRKWRSRKGKRRADKVALSIEAQPTAEALNQPVTVNGKTQNEQLLR